MFVLYRGSWAQQSFPHVNPSWLLSAKDTLLLVSELGVLQSEASSFLIKREGRARTAHRKLLVIARSLHK